MDNRPSRYHQWTWIVAIILGLLLIWLLLTGHGPSASCCNGNQDNLPSSAIDSETPFSFNAKADAFF